MEPAIMEKRKPLTNAERSFIEHIRCPRCGHMLAVGRITLGHITIKCPKTRCKTMVKVTQYGVWTE